MEGWRFGDRGGGCRCNNFSLFYSSLFCLFPSVLCRLYKGSWSHIIAVGLFLRVGSACKVDIGELLDFSFLFGFLALALAGLGL